MKTDTVLKALVQNSDGDFLLLRRSETDSRRPGQWDLPGGLWEIGEDLLAGVAREIAEESGLHARLLRPFFSKTETAIWVEDGEAKSSNICRIYFSAVVDGRHDVVLSYEHDMAQWVTLEQALDLIVYDRHKEVIQYILDNKLVL